MDYIRVKIFCKHEKSQYTFSRNSNDSTLKAFYIKFSEILNEVIKEAKNQHYSGLTAKSDNKIKIIWSFVKKKWYRKRMLNG